VSIVCLPALMVSWLDRLSTSLDRRSRPRFRAVVFGVIMCREKRRTASAWFRTAEIGVDFRQAYRVLGSVGRRINSLAVEMLCIVNQSTATANEDRSVFALDDSPTKRYGPCVEGAGIHHNPTPGPANQEFVYGHVWVTLARVVKHKLWGAIALPVRAELYVRDKDVPNIPPEYRWKFKTKLEQAVAMIAWILLMPPRVTGRSLSPIGKRSRDCSRSQRGSFREVCTFPTTMRDQDGPSLGRT
jgi:DDE superfamily endonuclease